jgi:hypothetical protein
MIFVVSNCCPVGCGFPVILLKDLVEDRLWSYCDACGIAWEHPSEARLEPGLNTFHDFQKQHADGGVRMPSADEVAQSNVEKFVIRIAQESEFKDIMGKLEANLHSEKR